MNDIKLTYNLQKDIDSGAIKVYSPNNINDLFKTYAHLEATARLHGFNPLEACDSLMSMYRMNYCRDENNVDRAWCFDVVKKWEDYYSVMKNKKKYKCKECGWKGKITEMEEGIIAEHCCPECNEEFDLTS